MSSESPTNRVDPAASRRGDLLVALTRALEVLGTAGDQTAALQESFEAAALAFGAEKALLLRVRTSEPLELEAVRAQGLTSDQVEACEAGRSLEGVSATLIRRAVETGEPQLVENSQFDGRRAGETGSLQGRPHSVLCAPVTDPWTRSPMAVLYFQTVPGPRGYRPEDVPFLAAYATALGHAFGLYLTGEQRRQRLEDDLERLRRMGPGEAPEIIGDTEETSRLRSDLHESYLPGTAVAHPRPILILGPTGSGKDLVARYLHYYSPLRSRGPFVEYNCAGLGGDLAQTTLFGHVRGAFTGATAGAAGLFRAAHRGVLFLDEIGEMPPLGQELLLKTLDRWLVQPVGDTRSHEVDVQVIAATSRDLAAAVQAGRFRHDLYQRLKPLTLRLSPLAKRRGDLRPLLAHFLARAERDLHKRTRGLTPDALRALLSHAWPGNVREVAGVCAALVTHARAGEEIGLDDLRRRCPEVVQDVGSGAGGEADHTLSGSFHHARSQFERTFLLRRLELFHWSVPEAARSLGISAATLYRYLQRHGLRAAEDQG
jgi:DNA-binding NtrC family response regulator